MLEFLSVRLAESWKRTTDAARDICFGGKGTREEGKIVEDASSILRDPIHSRSLCLLILAGMLSGDSFGHWLGVFRERLSEEKESHLVQSRLSEQINKQVE